MKAFVEVVPKDLSYGIHRVAEALRAAAPAFDVEIVTDPSTADLLVQHVIGWGSLAGWEPLLKGNQPRRVLMQYCLRTTEDPSPARWFAEWSKPDVAFVASYYDLDAYVFRPKSLTGAAPGVPELLLQGKQFQFYYAPLGADPSIFKPDPIKRALFQCATSGYVADTESVGEVAKAAAAVGGRVFHLGPNLDLGPHVLHVRGISDRLLAELYSGCRYVSGLRRVEGFELPAVEGLLCGARPIMFDTPDYRRWFDGFATFVPECSPDELTDRLKSLFSAPQTPTPRAVLKEARARFSWSAFADGFWRRLA